MSSPSASKDDSLTGTCSVCGSPASAHLHYGAVSCYSCRAFFRRGQPKQIRCILGHKKCEITRHNRTSCKLCRYDKCLEVGMKPERVDRFLAKKKEKAAQKNIDVEEKQLHVQKPNRSPSSEANSQEKSTYYVNSRDELKEILKEENSQEVRIIQEYYIKEEKKIQQITNTVDLSKQQNTSNWPVPTATFSHTSHLGHLHHEHSGIPHDMYNNMMRSRSSSVYHEDRGEVWWPQDLNHCGDMQKVNLLPNQTSVIAPNYCYRSMDCMKPSTNYQTKTEEVQEPYYELINTIVNHPNHGAIIKDDTNPIRKPPSTPPAHMAQPTQPCRSVIQWNTQNRVQQHKGEDGEEGCRSYRTEAQDSQHWAK